MDEFLSKLDVSPDADVDELPPVIARILSSMRIDPYSEPDAQQIRIILRAGLFLYGNLEIHRQILEQKLKDYQLIPKNELNYWLDKFHSGTLLSDICEQLLMTITGPNHIVEIQDFCNDFLDTQQYSRILSRVRESRRSQVVEGRAAREAKFLIITTFQLQSADEIELAIGRIVDDVEFDILAWIINLDESLTYFAMKCLIVQKELCWRLLSGTVSEKFVLSMYECAALSDDGASTYFKCLQNTMFASSLMTFFMSYLCAVEAPTKSEEQTRLMEHDHNHVSFLIAGMMSKKSDCRIEFKKKLTAVNINVLLSISHLNFVYEF